MSVRRGFIRQVKTKNGGFKLVQVNGCFPKKPRRKLK